MHSTEDDAATPSSSDDVIPDWTPLVKSAAPTEGEDEEIEGEVKAPVEAPITTEGEGKAPVAVESPTTTEGKQEDVTDRVSKKQEEEVTDRVSEKLEDITEASVETELPSEVVTEETTTKPVRGKSKEKSVKKSKSKKSITEPSKSEKVSDTDSGFPASDVDQNKTPPTKEELLALYEAEKVTFKRLIRNEVSQYEIKKRQSYYRHCYELRRALRDAKITATQGDDGKVVFVREDAPTEERKARRKLEKRREKCEDGVAQWRAVITAGQEYLNVGSDDNVVGEEVKVATEIITGESTVKD
eukprot:sb/3467357/